MNSIISEYNNIFIYVPLVVSPMISSVPARLIEDERAVTTLSSGKDILGVSFVSKVAGVVLQL
jgi:hypothetical protein